MKDASPNFRADNQRAEILSNSAPEHDQITPKGLVPRKNVDFGWDNDLRWTELKDWRNGTIEKLLETGADINATDSDGATPLHGAVCDYGIWATEALLKNGANLEARDNKGMTPLLLVVQKRREEHAELLLKSGADVMAKDNQGGTAIHWAARAGDPGMLELLLQHGALVDTVNDLGMTALHFAAMRNWYDVVVFLLEHGANPNVADTYGTTPLHLAKRHVKVMKLLLQKGANVNAVDYQLQTILHMAVEMGPYEAVEFLLRTRADIDARDNQGQTPRMLTQRLDIQQLFEKAVKRRNADPDLKLTYEEIGNFAASAETLVNPSIYGVPRESLASPG